MIFTVGAGFVNLTRIRRSTKYDPITLRSVTIVE